MASNDERGSTMQKQAAYFLLSSYDDSDLEILGEIVSNRSTVPKINDYVNNVVNEMEEKQFKGHFRLLPETAEIVIRKFEESPFFSKKSDHGGRPQITATSHILSFLWFAGNKTCLRDTAERFGMSVSSLARSNERVMDFLLSLGPSIIKMPSSDEEKEQMAAAFQNVSGFPGVLGCIDGTSIKIRTPAHKIKSTYVNRHDIPSLNLQAVCDFNRRFIDIFTGIPGKIHDSRVLKLSYISRTLPELCGPHYHLLGDNGYPIRKWLLVPYRDYGNLTERETKFNKKLSATRVLIENSFGILKGRFRQLLQIDMHSVPKITRFIIACCILHNICIDNNDTIEENEMVNDHDSDAPPEMDTEFRLKRLGEEKRNRLRDYLHYTN